MKPVIRLVTDDPVQSNEAARRMGRRGRDWRLVLAPSNGTLGDAAALCAGGYCLLVPAVRVLRTRVDVPRKGTARLPGPAVALGPAAEDVETSTLRQAPAIRRSGGRRGRAQGADGFLAGTLFEAGILPQAIHADSDAGWMSRQFDSRAGGASRPAAGSRGDPVVSN